jgi:metallo-beta-lactamase class B
MKRICLALLSAMLLSAATTAFAQGKRPADLSGNTAVAVPPIALFDNLYYVGNSYVCSYILKTSDGLIMIDTLYGEFSQKTIDAMKQVGLNPKEIRYVIVTHGHSDHYGGAKLVQGISDARVALTEADWTLMEHSSRGDGDAIVHRGARDIVIKDGDTLTLGDTTLKFYITPGHTPGVASMEFPVYDQGQIYKAFLFGGHNVTSNAPEAFEMFIASVKRLQATLTGVDVSLTSHPWAVEILERIEKLKTRKPGDPNPFVAPEEFKAFLQERLEDAQTRLAQARKTAGTR